MQDSLNDYDQTGTGHLDFDIEISAAGEPASRSEYIAAVLHSPAGETRQKMHWPYDNAALQSRLQDLRIALLQSAGTHRQALSPEEQTVRDFGRELFEIVFSGEVRSRFDLSQREARQRGKGLRIKLRLPEPELAMLPWEFLYDSRQGEYICLSRDTPIIRYLELAQVIRPLAVAPPLRILGMVASPKDLPALDIAFEKQRIQTALQGLQSSGLVSLTWLEGQSWRHLQQAMRGGPWHIFHFIGHGGFDRDADEGILALADENDALHRFRATELGRLLADHHSLRLVILNSCEGARGGSRDIFSSSASILLRRGIPAVLAMQYPITDRSAIEFARTFYETLADGLPVDAAVSEARKAVSLAMTGSLEWGAPTLYLRASQGVIFVLPEENRLRRHEPAALPANEQERRPQPPASAAIQSGAARRKIPAWLAVTGIVAGLVALLAAGFYLYKAAIQGTIPPGGAPAASTVYDDFENPDFEGSYNPNLWRNESDSPQITVAQLDGSLTITMVAGMESNRGITLIARQYDGFTIAQPTFFEARIKLNGNSEGTAALILQDGLNFFTSCYPLSQGDTHRVTCYWAQQGGEEKVVGRIEAAPGVWHIVRIEFDPANMIFDYFVDGERVASQTPQDIDAFRQTRFTLAIDSTSESASDASSSFDYVNVGPIRK